MAQHLTLPSPSGSSTGEPVVTMWLKRLMSPIAISVAIASGNWSVASGVLAGTDAAGVATTLSQAGRSRNRGSSMRSSDASKICMAAWR